jgi:hypothetical protein
MVINLFGDGMYYNIIELSAGELDKIKTISDLLETPIEELLFDLSVLESLGYDSISQFPSVSSGGGIRFEKETKFEWKGNRKTLRKFPITELSNDDLLFPAYLIKEINLDLAQFNDPTKIRFVLIEIIRGNLGKYSLDDTTQLEDVTFEFTTIQNQNKSEKLLTNIRYQGKKLKNKAKDGVILKQFAVRVG